LQAPFSYELRNGDVVSILTGDGKPATDWMRFAKSRSTRARLRAYFRAKQRESLQEAGAILLADFLKVHEQLISELSFMETRPPTTLREFAELLPKNSRFEDFDDLLVEIGKRHDRRFLRSTVAKVTKVPLWALDESERRSGYKGRIMSEKVFAAVRNSRRVAQDAGSAAAEEHNSVMEDTENNDKSLVLRNGTVSASQRQSNNGSSVSQPLLQMEPLSLGFVDGETQFADPEHICEDCLPVKGDDIVGTKAVGPNNISANDAPVIVHRRACIHAQRALNRKLMIFKTFVDVDPPKRNGEKSPFNNGIVGEGKLSDSLDKERFVRASSFKEALPVKLKWVEDENLLSSNDDVTTYLTEIVVVANDRKKLLADCSEIVSDIAFILKTGSATTNEHATLEFLVRVSDLDHLQRLMDSLRAVPSVMSVERKVKLRVFLNLLLLLNHANHYLLCAKGQSF
jgi:(p)ppGpp synthase/HD superfamily hydrolase